MSGMKTYTICIVAGAYAIGGWIMGWVDQQTAINILFGASGMSALRHGVSKGN